MQLSQLTQKELINHANCQSDLTDLETALLGLLEESPILKLEEEIGRYENQEDEMIKAMDKIVEIASEYL